MSATPDRQVQAGVAGEVHPGDDVGHLLRLDDDPRTPIEHAVVDRPSVVVAGIVRRDDGRADLLAKLVDRRLTHPLLLPTAAGSQRIKGGELPAITLGCDRGQRGMVHLAALRQSMPLYHGAFKCSGATNLFRGGDTPGAGIRGPINTLIR